MREFRQTSVRFTQGRLLFFVAAWLVVLLAYEGPPRFHLPYLWDGPVFSALDESSAYHLATSGETTAILDRRDRRPCDSGPHRAGMAAPGKVVGDESPHLSRPRTSGLGRCLFSLMVAIAQTCVSEGGNHPVVNASPQYSTRVLSVIACSTQLFSGQ